MTTVRQTPATHSSPKAAPVSGNIHVVKSGDTLSGIAAKHHVALKDVLHANPQIKNANLIYPGQHVKIPEGAAAEKPHTPAHKPASHQTQADSRQHGAAQGQPARHQVEQHLPQATGVHGTAGMTQAQKFDYYRNVIETHGGKFHDGPTARNIVGLRHETNPNSHGGYGASDDKFVMLWKDKSGHKHVREYTGTTEGNERNRAAGYSSDVNGDGRADLGRIPTGYYEYAPSFSSRLGNVLRPTHAMQVERDLNHDGKFTGREQHQDWSSSFLFHQGSSAGCQTMADGVWDKFWADVHSSGKPGKIGYTLVNA